MATIGPTLNATGISIPDFSDVFTELQSQFLTIYGADSNLDPETQDGQFISIFAKAASDFNSAAVDVYNSFQLNGAQGNGLSSLVKLVGIRRAENSFSTDVVTITGTPDLTILNGQVGDNLGQGTIWDLPSSVTIPGSGTINVTITNTQAGDVSFGDGDITRILTPQAGWQSVINIGPQVAGNQVQDDAHLRVAATNSVGGPVSTTLSSIFAAVDNVANVSRFQLYENDTDVNDANGQGPHSVYAVIQGGATQDIVNAIGSTKSPGTTTLGTTSGTYVDPSGVPDVIRYFILTEVTITLIVNLEPLAGFVTSTEDFIKAAIAQYLSSLNIGVDSFLNKLWAPANLSGDAAIAASASLNNGVPFTQLQLDALSATYNVTSILQSRPSDAPPAAQDVPIAFNEAAEVSVANITVNI